LGDGYHRYEGGDESHDVTSNDDKTKVKASTLRPETEETQQNLQDLMDHFAIKWSKHQAYPAALTKFEPNGFLQNFASLF